MFKNYFAIAFRTLGLNKVFTAINVLGLSIGISASLVIYLLINYHLTFDKFEKDGNLIYRVVTNFNFNGTENTNSGVTSPLGSAMHKELTGLQSVVAFRTFDDDTKITIPERGKEAVIFKKQNDLIFADESYFNLLGYEWVAGNAKTSMATPNQTVLTVSNASLYFPALTAAQVVGKQFILNDTVVTTIAGIVKDIAYNTSFTFKTFVSRATLQYTSLKPQDWDNWDNTNGASQLLVKLSPGTSVIEMQKSILVLYHKYKHLEPGDHTITTFMLQPLQDMHFNAAYPGYSEPIIDKSALYSLLLVGILLLLLGCINFINLTTAQATKRAKEIGVRKTMGSSKSQLVFQFFTETFLLTFCATLLSVFLTPFILEAFSGFLPTGLHFNLIAHPGIIVFLLLLIIFVTLLAGFYPALVLSGYNPVMVLKNQAFIHSGKTRIAWLRQSLTTTQFVIAQVFIMGVLLVSKQINYSLSKDMGFKKDAVITMQTNFYDTVQQHKYVLKDKLKNIPGIAMVSLSTNPPSCNNTWSGTIKYIDGKKEIALDVQQKYADTNYLHLYQIKLLAGRNNYASDTVNSFVINQTYLHALGFQNPQDAIGKIVEWNDKKNPIVGVVADFNQQSLHELVKPLVLGNWGNSEGTLNIELQPQTQAGDWTKTISKIQTAWKQVYPEDDFEYQFVDESIAKYYDGEKRISTLLRWASGLMILISCLGLLGLVMHTTAQRTKEIGVRKILGATVPQIISLLAKEFVLIVMIAFVIATPLAYIGMQKWLQSFAYRTSISWWLLGLTAVCMLLLTLLTVSIKTVKAALANPVKSLRNE